MRKFMPAVAASRMVAGDARNCIGGWAKSLAQADFMKPAFRREVRRNGSEMADRYGVDGSPIGHLLQQQIDACRAVVARHGLAALPMHGGWDLLQR